MNTEEKADFAVKKGYLAELRRCLAALPEDERESALTYYGEYFDDAGPDEGERVLSELGPAKLLAEQILSGYSRDYVDAGAGSYSTQVPAKQEDAQKQPPPEEPPKASPPPPQRRKGASLLLIIILVILALPLLIPLIATIFAVGIGLVAATLGIGVAIAALVVTMLIIGVVVLAAGLSLLVVHTASALLACGVGLALLGLGILFAMLCGFICLKVIPVLIRFIVQIIRWPFERKAVRA